MPCHHTPLPLREDDLHDASNNIQGTLKGGRGSIWLGRWQFFSLHKIQCYREVWPQGHAEGGTIVVLREYETRHVVGAWHFGRLVGSKTGGE